MRVIEAAMHSEPMQPSGSDRIVRFRPRSPAPPRGHASRSEAAPRDASTVADLDQFQRAGQEEDYRHRMVVNVLALAFCIGLALAGVWLIDEIAELRRVQDCALLGRGAAFPSPYRCALFVDSGRPAARLRTIPSR